MTPMRALLLGVAAYGAFLLATLPAAVVAPRVATWTGGQASLDGATGTPWNGSARLALVTAAGTIVLDELRWEFLPSRLLAGRAAFRAQARAGALVADAELARGLLAWRIDGLRAGGDASALAVVFPLAAAWQPGGVLAIEADRLAWDGRNASGEASAEWRDATLALSPARPLGTWRATAQAQGASVKVTLATAKGPLRLSGQGTQALPGRLAFTGEARAEAGREAELEALLALLGPRRADGSRAIELR